MPEARFGKTGKPVVVQPGGQGAHSWHPMSFSRRTNLLYTPVVETSQGFAPDPNYRATRRRGQCRHRPRAGRRVRGRACRCAAHFARLPDRVGSGGHARGVALGSARHDRLGRALATAGRPGVPGRAARRVGGLSRQRRHEAVVHRSADRRGGGAVSATRWAASSTSRGWRAMARAITTRATIHGCWCTSWAARQACRRWRAPPPPRQLDPPPQFGSAEHDRARRSASTTSNCTMCHDTAYGNRGLFPDLRYSPMINSRRGLPRAW